MQLAHLARGSLDDDVSQGHLAVAANGDGIPVGRFATHTDDGRSVIGFHGQSRRGQKPSVQFLDGARHHAGMLSDAYDVEKRSDQSMHIPELNMATFSLTHSNPIENTARCRKIHTRQTAA